MCEKKVYTIDGSNFETLEGFYDEVSNVLIPNVSWGRNLGAFNDILRGGFGTPDEGFVFRWRNADLSRNHLGYPETVRQLEKRIKNCHPSNINRIQLELTSARKNEGNTVFDWLVAILEDHGPNGQEAEDRIALVFD